MYVFAQHNVRVRSKPAYAFAARSLQTPVCQFTPAVSRFLLTRCQRPSQRTSCCQQWTTYCTRPSCVSAANPAPPLSAESGASRASGRALPRWQGPRWQRLRWQRSAWLWRRGHGSCGLRPRWQRPLWQRSFWLRPRGNGPSRQRPGWQRPRRQRSRGQRSRPDTGGSQPGSGKRHHPTACLCPPTPPPISARVPASSSRQRASTAACLPLTEDARSIIITTRGRATRQIACAQCCRADASPP